MGYFENGQWKSGWYPSDAEGRFVRPPTTFRATLEPISGRYHLYASLACPWAHRVLVARSLLGLEKHLGVTIVDWKLGDDGWAFFEPQHSPVEARYLRDVYVAADPGYSGRVTVPVIWDLEKKTIVNNESREVLRQLAVKLGPGLNPGCYDLSPQDLRPAIDQAIDKIYAVNNGVYQTGFAKTQNAYDEAIEILFSGLDFWDDHLDRNAFVVGDRLTEADICMFTTLIRFDPVYVVHFKCSRRRIADYPNLSHYLRSLYQIPAIRRTVDFEHIRHHYYCSHTTINPFGIVADCFCGDLDTPHNRWQRFPQGLDQSKRKESASSAAIATQLSQLLEA